MTWQVLTLGQTKHISLLLDKQFFSSPQLKNLVSIRLQSQVQGAGWFVDICEIPFPTKSSSATCEFLFSRRHR